MTAEPPPRTAYHWTGESEWCRLGAIDKAANVVRLCSSLPHAGILDVGAGEGSVLSRLAELDFGENYTAIDVSQTESMPSAVGSSRLSSTAAASTASAFRTRMPSSTSRS